MTKITNKVIEILFFLLICTNKENDMTIIVLVGRALICSVFIGVESLSKKMKVYSIIYKR